MNCLTAPLTTRGNTSAHITCRRSQARPQNTRNVQVQVKYPSGGKLFWSASPSWAVADRGHSAARKRLVIRAADDDQEEFYETQKFKPRKLKPLPADFGLPSASKPKPKKRTDPNPSTPASPFASPPPSGASPPASPFGQSAPPSSPPSSGQSEASSAPAKSPFSSSPSPPASPFASPSAAPPPASPFGGAASGKPVSPFGGSPASSQPSNPFGASSGLPSNPFQENVPIPEANKSSGEDKPWYTKLPRPTLAQLFLVFSFSTIIGLMVGTFYLVIQMGGVHFNDS